ncbi:hypothetical protein L2E82_34229 [Cichorium intybus]|uniref:Uncharacterized protein n=1 Tax=Cichorium intybus TaxID=13427 RepID=A0ACB9BM26_CICIN|nr:hypothetical protein L2E82_34229 [Cichorium intybus]
MECYSPNDTQFKKPELLIGYNFNWVDVDPFETILGLMFSVNDFFFSYKYLSIFSFLVPKFQLPKGKPDNKGPEPEDEHERNHKTLVLMVAGWSNGGDGVPIHGRASAITVQ